jgi:hypothetical protein
LSGDEGEVDNGEGRGLGGGYGYLPYYWEKDAAVGDDVAVYDSSVANRSYSGVTSVSVHGRDNSRGSSTSGGGDEWQVYPDKSMGTTTGRDRGSGRGSALNIGMMTKQQRAISISIHEDCNAV